MFHTSTIRTTRTAILINPAIELCSILSTNTPHLSSYSPQYCCSCPGSGFKTQDTGHNALGAKDNDFSLTEYPVNSCQVRFLFGFSGAEYKCYKGRFATRIGSIAEA